MLPLPVLERAASELVSYGDSGMSVLEMSHRSPDYEPIIKAAEASLRKLMNIPDEYAVLFLQGGASTQFAAVPLNLMPEGGKADYIVSGQFSGKAYTEALKYGDAAVAATSKPDNFTCSRHNARLVPSRRVVCPYLLQQHDIRHQIQLYPRHRRYPARCGYVLLHPLRAGGRQAFCRHICRRAEKRCSRGTDACHSPP